MHLLAIKVGKLLTTIRLANANRSRVSIGVTKSLAGAGGVVDPAQICFSCGLIITQNMVVLCQTVWAYAGNPRQFFSRENSPQAYLEVFLQ